jgi:hypothetical protein
MAAHLIFALRDDRKKNGYPSTLRVDGSTAAVGASRKDARLNAGEEGWPPRVADEVASHV